MPLFGLPLITAIATSVIVAHPGIEGPETSRILERDDWYQDYSLDYSNDQLFTKNLYGRDNEGSDDIFSPDILLDVSPNLYASALADDSQTDIIATNDAGCAANPSKRDISDNMLLSGEQFKPQFNASTIPSSKNIVFLKKF